LRERFPGDLKYKLKIRPDNSITLSNLDRNQIGDWSNAKNSIGRFPDGAGPDGDKRSEKRRVRSDRRVVGGKTGHRCRGAIKPGVNNYILRAFTPVTHTAMIHKTVAKCGK